MNYKTNFTEEDNKFTTPHDVNYAEPTSILDDDFDCDDFDGILEPPDVLSESDEDLEYDFDAEFDKRRFVSDVDKHLCALITGKGKLNELEILDSMNTAINIAKFRRKLYECSETVDEYIKAFDDELYSYGKHFK